VLCYSLLVCIDWSSRYSTHTHTLIPRFVVIIIIIIQSSSRRITHRNHSRLKKHTSTYPSSNNINHALPRPQGPRSHRRHHRLLWHGFHPLRYVPPRDFPSLFEQISKLNALQDTIMASSVVSSQRPPSLINSI
jgi:hypothetical protein